MPSAPHGIVRFFLYGEPERPAEDRFVHLETLERRSRPANWCIAAHAHADLHHVLTVAAGGGYAFADGRRLALQAPCIVVAPAGVVHAFRFRPETRGRVLTIGEALWRAIAARERPLQAIFAGGLWTAAGGGLEPTLEAVAAELAGPARLGQAAALEALVTLALVEVARLSAQGAVAQPGSQARLVARFRDWLETHHRDHATVEAAARALGVTAAQLRAACAAVAGVGPAQMQHDRLDLEARRLLCYSHLSIAQVAETLGFDDPAYFSRFFSRANGVSPRQYRAVASSDNPTHARP